VEENILLKARQRRALNQLSLEVRAGETRGYLRCDACVRMRVLT
jgi:hypothetical protein